MTTVLVTGAPGWLGTRLVEVLCENTTNKVRCLVQPMVDVATFGKLPVEIVHGDVRSMAALKEVVRGVETVFHIAGVIHPKRIKDLYEINTNGTRNAISAAAGAGVRRFIYISSNSAAGHNTGWGRPMTEGDLPRPYMGYGKSKFQAEQIVNEFHSLGRIETVIIRPCWYYGPHQPDRQTRLFKMIKSGKPLMFGKGNNLRSMSYIDNVVQGLLLAEKTPQANGQTYWIADESPYPTIEIYRTIAELLGVKLRPRFLPGFSSAIGELADGFLQAAGQYLAEIHVAGEMAKDIWCSIDKAKRELGYQPTVGLEEGMRRSITWCRENGIEI